tara:strand:- start:296104 stop:297135 length:1032 start_codon:yes stop_codon:yes gene_type:complete
MKSSKINSSKMNRHSPPPLAIVHAEESRMGMTRLLARSVVFGGFFLVGCLSSMVSAEVPKTATNIFIWPELAPGETSLDVGSALPPRPTDKSDVTRVSGVRRPSIDVFLPEHPNGTALLVLPGGGFGKIVPDMEGSATAPIFNRLGVAVFVLRYRTNELKAEDEPSWQRPLQDAQRAIRLIRSKANEWNINPERVGQLAFSAGGQVGAVLHTSEGVAAYDAIDAVDSQDCLPSFSMLVYPWRIVVSGSDKEENSIGQLLPEIKPGPNSPPAFIVHTHDDRSSSIGSVLLYAGLKRHGVMAELHVYESGGHGYGTRTVAGSNIGTWTDRATDWLLNRELATPLR